jgi:hypothetical protein
MVQKVSNNNMKNLLLVAVLVISIGQTACVRSRPQYRQTPTHVVNHTSYSTQIDNRVSYSTQVVNQPQHHYPTQVVHEVPYPRQVIHPVSYSVYDGAPCYNVAPVYNYNCYPRVRPYCAPPMINYGFSFNNGRSFGRVTFR